MRSGLVCAVLAAALLLVAGCGGDDAASAEDWAEDVCGELNDWADEVDATLQTLADRGLALDEDDVRTAVDRVVAATGELGADLGDLEPPETDSAQRAQEQLETLRDDLREQVDDIEAALESDDEPLEVVAAIATALSAAANQLQQRLDALEDVDPAGELADGFRESDECKDLRERVRG